MKNIMMFLVLTMMVSSAYASDCEYSRKIDRNVDLADVSKLLIEAGAGSLEIVGEPGRDSVQIKASLCSSSEELLEKMDVIAKVNTRNAQFETVFPDRSYFGFDSENMSIDLVLTVPSSASLVVKDSSGEALVEHIAELDMTDSSGRLSIENVSGDLVVVDSSGEMTLRQIGGDVEVTDSSGAIDVSDVKGSLVVIADSSGIIEAKRITNDVMIKRDSSGAIKVNDVGGDFIVLRDSSGGIHYANVDGLVKLPN